MFYSSVIWSLIIFKSNASFLKKKMRPYGFIACVGIKCFKVIHNKI